MTQPYIGELRIFPANAVPRGWAPCNGQLLPVNQYQPLFALLGTTFGGDGERTFALPDLQGRVPMHAGSGFVIGQTGGEPTHALTVPEMPTHSHVVRASGDHGTSVLPTGHFVAAPVATSPRGNVDVIAYNPAPDTRMNEASISSAGLSQPHENMTPYLVLNICISLDGDFPLRS
jgi:microcystin-dependent protein